LEKPSQKQARGVAQGGGEFKPQYHKIAIIIITIIHMTGKMDFGHFLYGLTSLSSDYNARLSGF
jgi:hypothetical protein